MCRKLVVWTVLAAVLPGLWLTAAPARAAEGKLALTAEKWQAYLYPVPRGKAVRLSGGTEPVAVAAGQYRLRYMIARSAGPAPKAKAKVKAQPAQLVVSVKKPITIQAGKTTEVKIGPPLAAVIKTGRKKDQLVIGLQIVDAGGNTGMLYAAPVGKKRPTPQIDVVDAGGKTVYSAALKFG